MASDGSTSMASVCGGILQTIFSYNVAILQIKIFALSIVGWRGHFVSMVYSFGLWNLALGFTMCHSPICTSLSLQNCMLHCPKKYF
jgi:hypothetical protein